MNTSKIIGIILIVLSAILGYIGVDKLTKSDASVEVVGIKLEASDNAKKREGYVYVGLAVLLFAGGIYTLNKK